MGHPPIGKANLNLVPGGHVLAANRSGLTFGLRYHSVTPMLPKLDI
jgi:hypothetical protein